MQPNPNRNVNRINLNPSANPRPNPRANPRASPRANPRPNPRASPCANPRANARVNGVGLYGNHLTVGIGRVIRRRVQSIRTPLIRGIEAYLDAIVM